MLTRRPGLVAAVVLFGATAYAPQLRPGRGPTTSRARTRTSFPPPSRACPWPPSAATAKTTVAGSLGGKGRVVTSNVVVTPGDVLQITVAGAGPVGDLRPEAAASVAADTLNGGGASDMRVPPFSAAERIVVAGGGGGAAFFGGPAGTPVPTEATAAGYAGERGRSRRGRCRRSRRRPGGCCCSGGTNGTATNGGNEGGGNFAGAEAAAVTAAAVAEAAVTAVHGGGGGAGGGSLGTPTGFNASPLRRRVGDLTHSATTIEVQGSLSPTSDPGRFDLKINGTTFKTDAGNGDTTQQQVVPRVPNSSRRPATPAPTCSPTTARSRAATARARPAPAR